MNTKTSDTFEVFFNSSARSAGARLFKEGKVSFSKPSMTEVISYVKPNYKVSLKLNSINSHNVIADCNCGPAKKGQLCKHVWAAFLAVFAKSADFFDGVVVVTKNSLSAQTDAPKSEAQTLSSEIYKLKQENFKLKQNAYRKEQYQKQKERAKEFKKKTSFKNVVEAPSYPAFIQTALTYFSENGFSFEDSLNESSVLLARKKLSRIFHPDVGGSHDEILQLNKNSEILLKYIGKS
jgi:uncharacterized Zn finger protein